MITALVTHRRSAAAVLSCVLLTGCAIAHAAAPATSSPAAVALTTLAQSPARLTATSDSSSAVCGYRHVAEKLSLRAAPQAAIHSAANRIYGSGAIALTRSTIGARHMFTASSVMYAVPVLVTDKTLEHDPASGAGFLNDRLMFDVNITGVRDLVSGKVATEAASTPIYANAIEFFIDARTGKFSFSLAC